MGSRTNKIVAFEEESTVTQNKLGLLKKEEFQAGTEIFESCYRLLRYSNYYF